MSSYKTTLVLGFFASMALTGACGSDDSGSDDDSGGPAVRGAAADPGAGFEGVLSELACYCQSN